MKDQGFAMAPGTHTLVGVKRYEVRTVWTFCNLANRTNRLFED